MQEENCGAADFATRFRINHPNATEDEISTYVVKQWRKISDQLGVALDAEELQAEVDTRPLEAENFLINYRKDI